MEDDYLECDLPDYVERSIKQLLDGRKKVNSGEKYFQLDMDWDELNADIGTAYANQEITERQVWYLKQKYLY